MSLDSPFRFGLSVKCLLSRALVGTRAAVALAAIALSNAHAEGYQIGVYYFPGWKDGQVGAPSSQPWKPIKAFPEREPLLGWYDEGSKDVMGQQLNWMQKHGISFLVFDWYWNGNRPLLDHALKAYFSARNRATVPFSLLWANHGSNPNSRLDFESMVAFWIDNYFKRPEYFTLDGKPVVFVFSHGQLAKRAAEMGTTVPKLLADAEDIARSRALKGIYFVGSTHWEPDLRQSGYSALSAYNYPGLDKESESYGELDRDYRKIWQKVGANSGIPYLVPMTQGWDKRPWGGSRDPRHDNSGSTPQEFEEHLRAARLFMDTHSDRTKRVGVICCWNEFGEGSFVEPTKIHGFQYLERIKRVFSGP
jgi:hypothetical protein